MDSNLNEKVELKILEPVLIQFLKTNEKFETKNIQELQKVIVTIPRSDPFSITKKELCSFFQSEGHEDSEIIISHIFIEAIERAKNGLPGSQKVIIEFSNDGSLQVANDILSCILERKEVRDRKAVVFSIVGPFRKGKSVLMDYYLRYLYFTYTSLNSLDTKSKEPERNGDWLGPPEAPLTGFSWKGGVEKHTYGIVMWSDVFLYDNEEDGEKYAIILIDTQGLFDHDTPEMVNAKIFSLTSLMSSIMILNLTNLIDEKLLQYLQFVTNFAKFSMDDQHEEGTFQNLCILIRDWQNSDDYSFGFAGGYQYLEDQVLRERDTQTAEMKDMRDHIRKSFGRIECFLMPHPGLLVASKQNFDGAWSKLDEKFVEHLKVLVQRTLSPINLKAKAYNGEDVTVSECLKNWKIYTQIYSSKDHPPVKSVYESSVAMFMNELVNGCSEFYTEKVQEQIQEITDQLEFDHIHLISKNVAVEKYKSEKKMGSSKHKIFYRNSLINEIEKRQMELQKIATQIIQKNILTKQVKSIEEKIELANQIAKQREIELQKQLQQNIDKFLEQQKIIAKLTENIATMQENHMKVMIEQTNKFMDKISEQTEELVERDEKHKNEMMELANRHAKESADTSNKHRVEIIAQMKNQAEEMAERDDKHREELKDQINKQKEEVTKRDNLHREEIRRVQEELRMEREEREREREEDSKKKFGFCPIS